MHAYLATKNGRTLFRASVRIYRQRVRQISDALAKRLGRVGATQLGEGDHFELPDPLARDAQLFADLQQRPAAAIADAIAQDDHRPLAAGQLRERAVQLFTE